MRNQTMIQESLNEMKNMTKREHVADEDMKEIRLHIEALVNEKSFIQKVMGFFTFVNIIWFIAIVGMTCTIGPCIWFFLGNCIQKMVECFIEFVKTVITFVVQKILLPLFEFLHNWGILEFCGYFLCFQFVAEGCRMDPAT